MTLGEYIKLKDCTLIDIINYAKTKGLELQNDDNYILSESELKIIDPILSFSLKYKTKGRKPSATQNLSKLQSNMNELQVEDRPEDIKSKQTDTSEPGASDVFRYGGSVGQELNVVGKIDLSTINRGFVGTYKEQPQSFQYPQQNQWKRKSRRRETIGYLELLNSLIPLKVLVS